MKMTLANNSNNVRLIAFYLPQYHPIPENDEWWGKDFTEWTNVTKAKPLFAGHYQPHLPADLGYYDLRQIEVRQAQANLAREHGIHGFCYYHYWFNGKQLLNRPFDEVLVSGEPDFPFCICWANENWTRTWDGLERNILIRQEYNLKDDRQHMRWFVNAFKDKRYIRVDGKPLLLIYRVSNIPNPALTAEIWRDEAQKEGIGDIYLALVESMRDRIDPTSIGFDAAIGFQPDWFNLGWRYRVIDGGNAVYDYASIVKRMLKKKRPSYKRFPCITPGWDNSGRRKKKAYILDKSTPLLYEKWLKGVIENQMPRGLDEKVVFVNAWNEWGEGAHLEPCQKWGRAYLEATKSALQNSRVPFSQSACAL